MAHLVISLQRGDLVANGELRTSFDPVLSWCGKILTTGHF